MYIPDSEKSGRKDALKKLLAMMGEGASDDLMAFKSERTISDEGEGAPLDIELEIAEGDGDVDDDDAESMSPSSDEKAMIAKLYKKYCM